MAKSSESVKRRRDKLRAMGLRPVQIWVPDTRAPGFAEECERQSRLVAAADKNDPDARFWDAFAEDNLQDLLEDLDRLESR